MRYPFVVSRELMWLGMFGWLVELGAGEVGGLCALTRGIHFSRGMEHD